MNSYSDVSHSISATFWNLFAEPRIKRKVQAKHFLPKQDDVEPLIDRNPMSARDDKNVNLLLS